MTPGSSPGADHRRPLEGVRVVVTRARSEAGKLVEALEQQGACVVLLPAIETRSLESPELDAALRGDASLDWTLFTSANTVRFVVGRARELGLNPANLAHLGSIAAVGSSTRRELESAGFRVDLHPAQATSEGLADELIESGVGGQRVFLPASRIARPVLPERLRAAGAEVVVARVYDTVCPAGAPEEALAEVRSGEVDVVTFTSPSTVRNFLKLAGMPSDGTLIATIGPVTAAEAAGLGLHVDITAADHSTEGLVRALVEHHSRTPRGSETTR